MERQSTSGDSATRVWRNLARGAWVLVAGVGVALDAVAFPPQLAAWATVCSGAGCVPDRLTPAQAQALQQAGLSPAFYAATMAAIVLLAPLVYLLVAALLQWRRADDPMALFTAFMLVTFGLALTTNSPAGGPLLQWATVAFYALGNGFFPLFVLLFPDGRFVPRWMRWVAPFAVALSMLNAIFPDNAILNILGLPIVGIPVVVYRYRHAASAIQRQQMKWVVLGIALALAAFSVTTPLTGAGSAPGSTAGRWIALGAGTFDNLCFALIPITIGIAILRYRLYDVDVIIRRTLIYAAADGEPARRLLRRRAAAGGATAAADRLRQRPGHRGDDAADRGAVQPAAPSHSGASSTGASIAASTMRPRSSPPSARTCATRLTWPH